MEIYRYKAMNAQGKILWGRTNALNVADLEVRLSRIGLDLITCKEIKSKGSSLTSLIMGYSIKRTELITLCFHLEQLLEAGVPMLEALADLRDSLENPRLREVTATLIESIQGGKNLSEAMRDFPYVFSTVFVNLIKAGEESGQLTQVLRNIIENLKWQDEQAAHTKRLFIYPVFIVVVIISVLFFLMTYVVPELLKFIRSMGQELPIYTKILIVVSNLFADYWYIFLGAPVIAMIMIFLGIKKNPSFSLKVDKLLLQVPIFGPILKKLILARFSNYFAIMYASGVSVLDCMRVGEEIVGNKAVEQAVLEARRQIADGVGISASFASAGLFPPLVIRMLRVGENTGALESALLKVSYFYTREFKESIERLQAMIEPTMTMILGALLAWIMISVLGPIYDLITQIKI